MDQTGLNNYRIEIDKIDRKIVELLAERSQISIKIGKLKQDCELEVYHPDREKQIYQKLLNYNLRSDFPDISLLHLYREIIGVSRKLQLPLIVAYLGPEASYTHMAALQHFGTCTDTKSCRLIADVFSAVESGDADLGVVPVENSTEGVVNHTLDRMLLSSLRISAEEFMPINHCLLSKNSSLSEINSVYAHPQSFSQCRKWLEENLQHVEFIECSSNARAAQFAVENEKVAAIAGQNAAEVYALNILQEHIEDANENITRFLIVGKIYCSPTGHDKTSIVCSIKDKPGALLTILQVFSRRKINMTRIESRPTRQRAWEYQFFIDIDGHEEDPLVREALDDLMQQTRFLKVLGSYPSGFNL